MCVYLWVRMCLCPGGWVCANPKAYNRFGRAMWAPSQFSKVYKTISCGGWAWFVECVWEREIASNFVTIRIIGLCWYLSTPGVCVDGLWLLYTYGCMYVWIYNANECAASSPKGMVGFIHSHAVHRSGGRKICTYLTCGSMLESSGKYNSAYSKNVNLNAAASAAMGFVYSFKWMCSCIAGTHGFIFASANDLIALSTFDVVYYWCIKYTSRRSPRVFSLWETRCGRGCDSERWSQRERTVMGERVGLWR